MTHQPMIISNVHPRGFAFGVRPETGEQVFIPPYVALTQEIQAGMRVKGMLVPNPKGVEDDLTPWQCIEIIIDDGKTESETLLSNLMNEAIEKEKVVVPVAPDSAVLQVILNATGSYVTTTEISEELGLEHRTTGNAANRLFNDGKIARAEVHNRVGQQRATVILWAASASCFIED